MFGRACTSKMPSMAFGCAMILFSELSNISRGFCLFRQASKRGEFQSIQEAYQHPTY